MEKKTEFSFSGSAFNGFLMLFVNLAVLILSIVGIIYSIIMLDDSNGARGGWLLGACGLLLLINIICWCGFLMLEPNEARVLTWWQIQWYVHPYRFLLGQPLLQRKEIVAACPQP